METKKSNLFFVKDHDSFDDEGIAFLLEMLNWPIHKYYKTEEVIDEKYQKVIKNALFAMTQLSPFKTKISLGIDEKKQRLFILKRTWGLIYLKDQCIIEFSHDTRHDNSPFVDLFDWIEIINLSSSPQYEGYDNEVKKVINWSSRENWKQFFIERIEDKVSQLICDSATLVEQLTEKIQNYLNISNGLKKNKLNKIKKT